MSTKKESSVAIWQYIVVGLCHFGLGALGAYFYLGQDYQGPGWPAIGVSAGFLVLWGFRLWRSVFASALALHVFFLHTFQFSAFVFAVGECGEVMLAAFLLTRGLDWSQGLRTAQQLKRGVFVGLIAPLLGAAMGTLGLWMHLGSGAVDPVSFQTFFHWWLRSALGFLMLAPVVGSWPVRPRFFFGPNPAEGIAMMAIVIGLCWFSFSNNSLNASVPLWSGLLASFALCWCGARCGLILTTHLSVVILACASLSFFYKAGIFDREISKHMHSLWWVVLYLCTLSSMALSVLNSQADYMVAKVSSARRKLELLVLNSPLAMVEWDLDFRIRVWSRKAYEVFGFTESEIKGESGLELLVPIEERMRVTNQWLRVIEGVKGVRSTNHNLTASGKTILCDWYGSPVYDERGKVVGVVAMAEDVTHREFAAAKLQESEKRFQTVAEVIPQAISYYTKDLVCLYGNTAFLDSHHLAKSQLPMTIKELASAEDWERISPVLKRVREGETLSLLETVEQADGNQHDLDRALLPDIGPDGEVRGFFSVCTDITQYREASEEKLALETQILQTQKLESLSLLSGKIAHEFNNRLCGILGHADMANKDLVSSPSRAGESLDRAITIAREASELCRQLFVYSGFGSGEKLSTSVKPFVLDIRRLLELTIPSNIRLRTRLEEPQPMVLVDHAQLRQALVNIVQNAAQAIGKSSGEIWISSRLVRASECDFLESFLSHEKDDLMLVELAITDDGEGIPEKEIRQNFEPFFTRRQGARGLGLAGVLGIVHGHSGAIAVESEQGEGTSVNLYFVAQGATEAPVSEEEVSGGLNA